jgi:hypothetical protein
MLVTLHSAAIVIQQHYRKRLVNRHFYNDSSINYVDTSEDGLSSDPKNQTIDYTQKMPERVLTANTSPLRTKVAIR